MMSGTMPGLGVAMPEWLNRRDFGNEPWAVQAGHAKRGDAWTDNANHQMRVPFGGDETNRVIRAHEMMHAKVSPRMGIIGTEFGISEGALRAAEEFRVNQLARAAGFDMDLLVDGSERVAGERLAQMQDYAGLVESIVATANTKGAMAFLRGVRNIDPELAKALRNIEKECIARWKPKGRRLNEHAYAATWGSTEPIEGEPGYTVGYKQFTVPLAQMIDAAINTLTPSDDDDLIDDDLIEGEEKQGPAEKVKKALKTSNGQWGVLLFDIDVRLTKTVKGMLGKKRRATNVGRNPRRINRMLTDPQRRVFDKVTRSTGGVVVIDQSGSMGLSDDDVEQMMNASPGCTIIGYSHSPGTTHIPNIWILAKDGKRAGTVRKGNGGNGVDGPALRFAIKHARKGEPVIWVCDGVVTDGQNDNVYRNLTNECARLVKSNRVHMTPDVKGAIASLTTVSRGERLPVRYTGRVLDAAQELGFA